MTPGSPAHFFFKCNATRNLTFRIALLLFLFVLLLGGAGLVVVAQVSDRKYNSVIINVAGRQRLLAQRYAGESVRALLAAEKSDPALRAASRRAALDIAAQLNEAFAALNDGGWVEMPVARERHDSLERVRVPSLAGADLFGHYDAAKDAWRMLSNSAWRPWMPTAHLWNGATISGPLLRSPIIFKGRWIASS